MAPVCRSQCLLSECLTVSTAVKLLTRHSLGKLQTVDVATALKTKLSFLCYKFEKMFPALLKCITTPSHNNC